MEIIADFNIITFIADKYNNFLISIVPFFYKMFCGSLNLSISSSFNFPLRAIQLFSLRYLTYHPVLLVVVLTVNAVHAVSPTEGFLGTDSQTLVVLVNQTRGA